MRNGIISRVYHSVPYAGPSQFGRDSQEAVAGYQSSRRRASMGLAMYIYKSPLK
jgi:hypothetical protein